MEEQNSLEIGDESTVLKLRAPADNVQVSFKLLGLLEKPDCAMSHQSLSGGASRQLKAAAHLSWLLPQMDTPTVKTPATAAAMVLSQLI